MAFGGLAGEPRSCDVVILPEGWREIGTGDGGVEGSAHDKFSVDALLRTRLLLHLECGHLLRETQVRAIVRRLRRAKLSDVPLLKRLIGSRHGVKLIAIIASNLDRFREQGVAMYGRWRVPGQGVRSRRVKELARTGSRWRLHYSVRLPNNDWRDPIQAFGERGRFWNGMRRARIPIDAGELQRSPTGLTRALRASTMWCLQRHVTGA